MKHLFTLIAICLSQLIFAQSTVQTAIPIESGYSEEKSNISPETSYLYRIITPGNGAIRISLKLLSWNDCSSLDVEVLALNEDSSLSTKSTFSISSEDIGIDTFYIAPCLAADTFYVQIKPYSCGEGTYSFKCEYVPTPVPSDIEPNNTWEEAILINDGETKTGDLNYPYDGDKVDYYKIVLPDDGKINFLTTL